jgi:hypothetical protein
VRTGGYIKTVRATRVQFSEDGAAKYVKWRHDYEASRWWPLMQDMRTYNDREAEALVQECLAIAAVPAPPALLFEASGLRLVLSFQDVPQGGAQRRSTRAQVYFLGW